MKETVLRRRLLENFYDHRSNASGWNVTPMDLGVSLFAKDESAMIRRIMAVCGEFKKHGLIGWRPSVLPFKEYFIGVGMITADGIAVFEGTQPPPFLISGLARPLHDVDVDLRLDTSVAISEMIPDQFPAPVRVEERDGKITRISDRDSPLLAAEQDFNAWRQPVLSHIQELLSGDFRFGTNHSRIRDRLVALGGLLPGRVADVKDRQFNIGYGVERLEGIISAYRGAATDMPDLNAAVLEDLDRLRITLVMGMTKLDRWNDFRRASVNDPLLEGIVDTAAISRLLKKVGVGRLV